MAEGLGVAAGTGVQRDAAVGQAAVAVPSGRWPSLDGMRGLMTIGVFTAHISYGWLPGSILFMDSFFMMSSFFITRLLLKDWLRHGRLDLKSFYWRRVRRLYPALLVMVLVIAGFFALYRQHGPDRMLNVLGTLFYFLNWLRAFGIHHEGYFGHTWSLSIEEQYYLVWPALFGAALVVLRWRQPPAARNAAGAIDLRFWVVALGGIALATMLWRYRLASSGASWERLYNGTDMRLDSLSLGALLAIVYDTRPVQRACERLAQPWLVWTMIAVMMAGAFKVNVYQPAWYAWQQPLFVLLSLALIMSFLKTPTGWGLRFAFQNPVSLYLGAICYGLYLWHYPLIYICYAVFDLSIWQCLFICAPLSVALASLSFHWIELPALKGNRGSAR